MNFLCFDRPYIEVSDEECAGNVHTIPYQDWFPHMAHKYCFCKPKRSKLWDEVWLHNSYDGRELEEKGKSQ